MTEAEYAGKLADLDRLLNDPDVRMQPARVWALLAEIAAGEPAPAAASTRPPGPPAECPGVRQRVTGGANPAVAR
jgi:hypothetical protein